LLANKFQKKIFKAFFLILLFSITLILQASFLNKILFFGVKPDLLLICIFLITLHQGLFYGEVFGFIIGLAEDSLSGCVLGTNAFSKVLISYLINLSSKYFQIKKSIIKLLLLFLFSFINAFLIILLNLPLGRLTLNIYLIKDIFWSAIYTVFMGIFVLWGLKLLRNEK